MQDNNNTQERLAGPRVLTFSCLYSIIMALLIIWLLS